MSRCSGSLAVTFLLAALTACESGPHSSAGFHLPLSGDAEKGRVAFHRFDCDRCHDIGDLKQTQEPAMAVRLRLGGGIHREPTDGGLATSIIHPSYRLARYPRDQVTGDGGESLMPHYAGRMTVQELTDLVTFLQSEWRPHRARARR